MSTSDETPTTSTASNEHTSSKLIRETWVNTMDALLDALHEAYSDEPDSEAYDELVGPNLATQRTNFKLFALNSPDLQEKAIRAWHDVMNPYYKLCREKNDKAILKSHCWVLEKINFRHIWNDKGLDKESRECLWDYVNKLNTYAGTYCSVPESILNMAERMTPALESASPQDMIGSVMNELGSINPDDFGGIMNNLPSLLQTIPTLLSSTHDTDSMGQFGALINSAMSFSKKIESDGSETDTFNIEQIMKAFTSMGTDDDSKPTERDDDDKCDD